MNQEEMAFGCQFLKSLDLLLDQAENILMDLETIKLVGTILGAVATVITLGEKFFSYGKRAYLSFKKIYQTRSSQSSQDNPDLLELGTIFKKEAQRRPAIKTVCNFCLPQPAPHVDHFRPNTFLKTSLS